MVVINKVGHHILVIDKVVVIVEAIKKNVVVLVVMVDKNIKMHGVSRNDEARAQRRMEMHPISV